MMKLFQHILLATLTFSVCNPAMADDDAQTSVEVVKLTDTLYKIQFMAGFESNMVASIGKDGLLLVDTGFKATANKLKAALLKLGNAKPVYIINTHEHIDHTGGNAVFGEEPIIIGHRELRKRMQSEQYILQEYPQSAIPEITFTDALTLYFNGEEIRLYSITGSHTDNDIMVHFTGSGYAYLGDVAYGLHIPSLDALSGDSSQYAVVAKQALDRLPDDTKFVSGHGRDLSMGEMREWQQMLHDTIAAVRSGLEQGKDIETMQAEKILAEWEKYASGGYVSTDAWIAAVANNINGVRMTPKLAVADYYRAFHQAGVEAVKNKYYQLKEDKTGEYNIQPYELYMFSAYLLDKGLLPEAIDLFGFSISEYPDVYYLYDGMGEAYWKNGNNGKAIDLYKKSLELQPANTNAERMMKLITDQ